MKKIKLHRAWRGPTGIFKPGEYRIPTDISMTHAKCARADGAGEIVETANFRGASRKGPAPENKAMEAAPENKTELGEPDGDSGGERAEPKPRAIRSRAPKRSADTSGE